MDTKQVSLGKMTWNKGRAAAAGYDFRNVTGIDATNFRFSNPEEVTGNMTLLSGATNLAADKAVTNPNPSQTFNVAANGATLTETLNGTIATTTGAVNYTKGDVTLDKVNLANWNGTAYAISGFTSNLGANSITAAGFTAPTLDAGTSTNILTTTTNNFFSDAQITGAMKYKEDAESSDTTNGVTLTGSESKGVKASADGKNLVYARSNFNVSNISFGEMTWGAGRAAASGYNYAEVSALDTSGLALTIADPESLKAGDSTTFLKANDTLKDMAAQTVKDVAYSVSPVAGASVSAAVRGSVSARGGSVVYTVTENKASKLTFTNVNWLTDGALIDHKTTLKNVSFDGADVDTAKISFTNLQTLDTDSKMTLISGFGTSAGAVNGSTFTVGKGTGEGHAYLESSNLKYVVTQGVDFKPTGDDNAINEAGAPVGGEIASDVIGGVARNNGVAKETR